MSPSSPWPSQMRSTISSMRLVPTRQGTHLPQLSFLGELEEEARHVDHAGVLVHDDQAAGAHDGAELAGSALVVDRRVEVRSQARSRRKDRRAARP